MELVPIKKEKLKELVRLSRHYNIAPIFLPNYLTKFEKHPVSELLDDLTTEVLSLLEILDESEVQSIHKSLSPGISMMVDLPSNNITKEDLERLAVWYIAFEVSKSYFSLKTAVKNDLVNSEILKIYPELERDFDEDNLLIISDKFKLLNGGIEYKDHILHYNQFLRRGYNSNPNYDFLDRFFHYYNITKSLNTFRISLDHSRIMLKQFYQQISEFDSWFGPPFNSEKLDDPNYKGLTIVKRNKNSLFESNNKLDRTEFYWSIKNKIKSLEIEEISDIGYLFEDYNVNKYVHSERDIENHKFRHIDGAVKIYLRDKYESRFSQTIPKEDKSYKKIKLWRIDGAMHAENWIDVITFFYKGNEMIIEYFNPKAFEEMFELRIRDTKKWKELNKKKI